MTQPTTYEIVIRGRAGSRLLWPLLDDFTIDHLDAGHADHADEGVTRLVGVIGDASHLHGVLVHLTSVNLEVISVSAVGAAGTYDGKDMTMGGPQEDGTMRAVVQDGYGDAGVLRLTRVPRPEVSGNKVLLRVRAAGLDRGVWHVMKGLPYLIRPAFGLRGPRNPIPGRDVSGTVVAVGPDVTGLAVGDEVFGIAPGSFAEYAIGPEDKLARKPAGLTFEQAAVMPISAIAALRSVCDIGGARKGQQVLVTGASGGVGSFAVQFAKAAGAEVTGVCAPAKAEYVRSLGADHVIDYTHEDFADGSRRYDLIVNIAGNPTLAQLRRALVPGGTAVFVGGEHGGKITGGMGRQLRGLALSPFVRRRLTGFVPRERASDFGRLADLFEAGTVTPSIGATYPLEQVREAMRHLDAGEARGKIVLTV